MALGGKNWVEGQGWKEMGEEAHSLIEKKKDPQTRCFGMSGSKRGGSG